MAYFNTFMLLDNIALFSLLSLLIPFLIHLFNRTKGRVVMVGNIHLIKQAKKIKITEIKLTQILLLILRLLILVILSLLVSQLVKLTAQPELNEQQIYITPEWVRFSSDNEIKQLLEKHHQAKFYWLTVNFPAIQNKNLQTIKQQYHLFDNNQWLLPIDSLLAELNSQVNTGKQKVVYITNRLQQYAFNQLNFQQNIIWKIKALTVKNIETLNIKKSHLNITIIYDEERQEDFNYLKLALNYLNKVNIGIFQINSVTLNKNRSYQMKQKQPDWIFWLSNKNVDNNIIDLVHQGSHLFEDSKDNNPNKTVSYFNVLEHQINLFIKDKETSKENDLRKIILKDNKGASVLSKKNLGLGQHYYFASRFHVDWNNWVEQPEYPLALLSFMLSEMPIQSGEVVHTSELMPNYTKNINLKYWKNFQKELLLLLCFLWFIERIVSEKSVIKRALVTND